MAMFPITLTSKDTKYAYLASSALASTAHNIEHSRNHLRFNFGHIALMLMRWLGETADLALAQLISVGIPIIPPPPPPLNS